MILVMHHRKKEVLRMQDLFSAYEEEIGSRADVLPKGRARKQSGIFVEAEHGVDVSKKLINTQERNGKTTLRKFSKDL